MDETPGEGLPPEDGPGRWRPRPVIGIIVLLLAIVVGVLAARDPGLITGLLPSITPAQTGR